MSLASKQAYADQLRTELSALRAQREAALHDGHAAVAEERVDAEIERLKAEVEMAKAQNEAVVSGGSVEDALAAMRAAAAEEKPDGSVDLAVPIETETNGPVVDSAAVADEAAPPAEGVELMLDLPVVATDDDAQKADGE